MKKTISQIRRIGAYQPLLEFANETLTKENWKAILQRLDQWELSWWAAIDSGEEMAGIGKINGSTATFERALELRERMRNELSRLAARCCDESRRVRGTDTRKAWTWRKALVLPTGERFMEDYGERFGFLVEALEHELGGSADDVRLPDGVAENHQRLHLSLCRCGCGTFFLWEGNWNRKQRKFLNDQDRMKFHNRQNVERKRDLARQKRAEGKYQ
jgi:hypothetical protein